MRRLVALGIAVAVALGVSVLAAGTGVTAFTSHRTSLDEILSGSWQSCQDADDDTYGERVFLYRSGGQTRAEIHLGPRAEFGIFVGEVEEERAHAGRDNLLGPAYQFDDVPNARRRSWTVPSLNLAMSVVKAGGSHDECYSFYIQVVPMANRTLAW